MFRAEVTSKYMRPRSEHIIALKQFHWFGQSLKDWKGPHSLRLGTMVAKSNVDAGFEHHKFTSTAGCVIAL